MGLEREGRDGIWARILKNAFAPIFAGQFDYVAGNPPWVNWESLADQYREATKEMWQRYGLFSLKGHAARLGGGKKDVAMLMLYAAMDSYLKDDGKLGFVITQTVFKTKGAGDGFRRFRLGEDGAYLEVLSAHDLVELQPFEGASNSTATVTLRKGQPTEYPVSYTLWRKTKPGRIAVHLTLAEVEERTKRMALSAQPVTASERTSPWLTASPATLDALGRAVGRSDYEAHAGACGWLNGVYWLRILERRPDGLLVVENLHDVGDTKLKKVPPTLMEPDLVYPLLRGRDVARWSARPSAYILMVQDPVKRTGYDESWLKVTYPHTYAYLEQFGDTLRQRSGYRKYFDKNDPFYSMYDVGKYTFAPYKVVWREQASELTAAAVSALEKAPIPDHKLMLVECATADEAFYMTACLNSVVARLVVKSYVVAIGMSTHVLKYIAIPRFDSSSPLHHSLATLSQHAHQLAAAGKQAQAKLPRVEEEVDDRSARLWGISAIELRDIREALADLG